MAQVNGNALEFMIYLNCKITKQALEVALEAVITTRATIMEEVAMEAIDEMEQFVEAEMAGEIQGVIVTAIDGQTSPVHGEMEEEIIKQARTGIIVNRVLDGLVVVIVEGLIKITTQMEVSITSLYILIFRRVTLHWQLTIHCDLREPQ